MTLKTSIYLFLFLLIVMFVAANAKATTIEGNAINNSVNDTALASSPIVDIGMVAREQIGKSDNNGTGHSGNERFKQNKSTDVHQYANMLIVERSFIIVVAIILAIVGIGILIIAYVTRPRKTAEPENNITTNLNLDYSKSVTVLNSLYNSNISENEPKIVLPNLKHILQTGQKSEGDNLPDVARKLGIGTGELTLAVHLKELREKKQLKEAVI